MMEWMGDLAFFTILGFAISYGFSHFFSELTDSCNLVHLHEMNEGRRLMVVGVMLAAGPHVLIRETAIAQAKGRWPAAFLLCGYGLAVVWSGVLGFALGQVVLF
jgi:hypothetical protein